MALIRCPECGKKVSDQAKICIHCGYPLAERPVSAKMDNGQSAKSKRATGKNKFFVISASVGLALLAAVIAIVLVVIPNRKYNSAISLMDEGRYLEAISIFVELDNYKDSVTQITECQYRNALHLMDAGEYQEAVVIFVELNDYRDSNEKVLECYYNGASLLMENERFQEAIVTFESLGDYKDSKDKITECHYYTAISLMAVGRYQEARIILEVLEDYNDTADMIVECDYYIAVSLMNAGEYQEALAKFESISNYEDSAEKIAFCQQGVHYNEITLLAEENPTRAAIAFAKMGDFLDANERSRALWDLVASRETVSAGDSHTVAIMSDGSVVAIGSNSYNQCDVSNWNNIVAVTAGDQLYTVGLRNDGSVVAVGWNWHHECDVGDWTDIVAISSRCHTVGLRSDGTVVAVGWNTNNECNVSSWTDIVAIAAGGEHTVGLKEDGTVVAVGENYQGSCNVSSWSDIVAVAAGTFHTVGLRVDGTVVARGDNTWGQCNVSSWSNIIAIDANAYYTVGLRQDGAVVIAGNSDSGKSAVRNWSNNPAVLAVMKEWKREQTLYLLAQGYPREGYCFTRDNGRVLNPQAPTSYLSRFGKKYGVENLHPHALRHTMATISIANGADIVSVSEKLGHSETSVTLDVYSHVNKQAQMRANQALSQALYTTPQKTKNHA